MSEMDQSRALAKKRGGDREVLKGQFSLSLRRWDKMSHTHRTNCPVVSPDQERGGSSKSAKSVSVLHTKIQIGDDPRAEEKFQWKGYDDAVEEFARFFQEINGNDFESREIK
ncbi:hypothetical protein LguiA_021321 [Lonicera macranthoides]